LIFALTFDILLLTSEMIVIVRWTFIDDIIQSII